MSTTATPGPCGLSSSQASARCVSNYYYPSQPAAHVRRTDPAGPRDTINNQEIVKLQYQKNFGSHRVLASLRLHLLQRLAAKRSADRRTANFIGRCFAATTN